jgi:hypothetical protein
MRKRMIILVVFISLFLLSGNAIAQGPNIKEGLWEITTTIEESGMPKEMLRQTYKHCLTKNDYIPYKEEKDKECKVTKFDVKGNTVSWVVKCKDEEGTSIGNGRVTYRGDTFEGLIKFKDPEGEITMTMKGKWVGKCQK